MVLCRRRPSRKSKRQHDEVLRNVDPIDECEDLGQTNENRQLHGRDAKQQRVAKSSCRPTWGNARHECLACAGISITITLPQVSERGPAQHVTWPPGISRK